MSAAATSTPVKKQCGVCSKPITTGYFTYGDYCGTTVCIQCMSKNTWSMCRTCNGSLFECKSVTDTIDLAALATKQSHELGEIHDAHIKTLYLEQERIKRIKDFAEQMVKSATKAQYSLEDKIAKLRKEYFAAYINKCKSEYESGVLKLFTLTPKHEHSAAPVDLPLVYIKTPITKEHIEHTDTYTAVYTLTLNPSSKTMRVRFRFQDRHKSVVYKMDAEYREILAQSGHVCEIEFMECQAQRDWHTMCVAIKTSDGYVHVIYADELKYPYSESRYIGKTISEHTLTSLRLKPFIDIRHIKPAFLR